MAIITKTALTVASCFLIFDGGTTFYTVRSHLEILRKRCVNLLHALVWSFLGKPPQPSMG